MTIPTHFFRANSDLAGEDYLLQILPNGEVYQFYEGIPEWFEAEYFDLEDCDEISYAKAIEIEKTWSKPFWNCHENDLLDFSYQLANLPSLSVQITISSGEFCFINKEVLSCKPSTSKESSTEKHVLLDKENTRQLLYQLRLCYDIEMPLDELFETAFGLFAAQKQCDPLNTIRMHGEPPLSLLLDFCKKHDIQGTIKHPF